MLGPVTVVGSPAIDHPCRLPDWVIAGPETGARHRPCEATWLSDIERECGQSGIPFFDSKQKVEERLRGEMDRLKERHEKKIAEMTKKQQQEVQRLQRELSQLKEQVRALRAEKPGA